MIKKPDFKKLNIKRINPVIIVAVVLLAVLAVANAIRIGFGDKGRSDAVHVSGAEGTDYPMAVYFLDVGQGDGTVIRCGDTVLMIDGGEREREYEVTEFLKAHGIDSIDCYIASHPHSDHIGAAAAVFGAMNVKSVMLTSFSDFNTPTTETYERFLNAIAQENCKVYCVSAGDEYTFGELKLQIYAPVEETSAYNDMSVVVKITYGNTSFLFTGDATKESERLMLERKYDLHANVLKVAHHGSSDATSAEFLKKVAPNVAVISCGKNNDYGHPHKEVLSLLKKENVTVYRTDKSGNIVIYSDGKNLYTGD